MKLWAKPRQVLCFATFTVITLVVSGCATPVGVQPVDIQTAYRIHTESALSVGQPSEPSKTVLRRLGLLDRFDEEPVAVLAELHGGLSSAGDDDRLFALAELSSLHAERTGDRAHFRLRPSRSTWSRDPAGCARSLPCGGAPNPYPRDRTPAPWPSARLAAVRPSSRWGYRCRTERSRSGTAGGFADRLRAR
jgi:hypothetical protein